MPETPSPPIPRRRIGSAGPETGILSLGSWHTYDRMEFSDAARMLREAVDSGVDLFDVAVYGWPGGLPSGTDVIFSALSRAAGLRREDYLLSAKLWLGRYPDQSLRAQLDNALLRAGVEYADLVVLGDVQYDDTDFERIVSDLSELAGAGLIRQWGVNNWSAANVQRVIDIAAANHVAGPALAQLKYSVARRSIPDGDPFAKLFEQGMTMQASDVLEGGVLLGKGQERMVGRDRGEVRERITDSVAGLRDTANDLGVSPAQLCIAFTLTHPANSTTLVGASSQEQLADNLAAVSLLERVGSGRLRELVEPFWADRDTVDPEGP